MATSFTKDPAALYVRKDYAKLLQRAFDKVGPELATHEFLYYPKFDYDTKKAAPLILVDFDPKLPAALKSTKSLAPTAKGFVSLTPTKELAFAVEKDAITASTLASALSQLSIRQEVLTDDEKAAQPATAQPAHGATPVVQTSKPAVAPLAQVAKPAATPAQPAATAANPRAAATPAPSLVKLVPSAMEDKAKARDQEKADALAVLDAVRAAPCAPADLAKRDEFVKAAVAQLKKGEFRTARLVLEDFSKKHLQAKPGAALSPEDQALANTDADDDPVDLDDDAKDVAPALDKPEFKAAAMKPGSAVAMAQQALIAEEAAFKRHKNERKADKIMASTSQLAKAQAEKGDKAVRKALEAQQPKPSFGDQVRGAGQSVREAMPFGKKKDKDGNEPVDRIEQSLNNKKSDDELKKLDAPLKAVGVAGSLDSRLAKGIGAGLDSGNQGDDIASAAGTVATATAGAAASALEVVRAMKLWNSSKGAERSVHLRDAAEALGAMVGNLVNISKGSVNIAQHSNAVEAGATVPILGIVAAVPALISEINQLRAAIYRLHKQMKVHVALEKAVKGGDSSQATLYTIVTDFTARDGEKIGKGIARVALDLTKIAGHGVTAGGITGPLGAALIGVGTAGKLLISAAESVQGLQLAHEANDRRKKLQPTLHAKRDWDALAKTKPGAPENKALGAALDAAAQVEKGTPAHADALDKLIAAAEAFKKNNGSVPKSVAYATDLIEKATAEKKSWERDEDEEDDSNPLAQKKGHGLQKANVLTPQEAQHRDARKLLARDPRVAAQTLLEQAIREGAPGGPAFKVLESFGIKASQVYGKETGDDRVASNREMRQKVLYKMGVDDETALTLSQSLHETKDSINAYLAVQSKHAELNAYMKAKNLLQHGGEAKRGPGWRLKMELLTDDVEEKKLALLEHMEVLVGRNDIDLALAAKVRVLLRPRDEKKAA